MEDLFNECRKYGRVGISTIGDGRFWAKIEFNTIKHTKLNAESGLVNCPVKALTEALENAIKIYETFADAPDLEHSRKLINAN